MLVCLLFISTVSAEEINNGTNNLFTIENDDTIVLNELEVLNSNPNESFTDLANDIGNATNELNLTDNHVYLDSDSKYKNGISINSRITIDGHDHIIGGNYKASIFSIDADDVTLKNIRFSQGTSQESSGAINWKGNNGIIINCTFESNSGTPGALLVDGVNCSVINCTFKDNKIKGMQLGGAILWKGINGKIINSTVTRTQSQDGGAVYWSSKNAEIINCTFSSNSGYMGAAIEFGTYYGTSNNAQVINSTFISNNAHSESAIRNYGDNSITIDGCKFIKNRGTYDIVDAGSKSSFNNCIFYMNSGFSSSSQISSLISAGNITNCIFLNNTAKEKCLSIVGATNLNYNWFGNTFNDYTIVPNASGGLKNWLFLNATHERLMLVGEEMSVPFVFQVWDGTSVLNYDSSKVYPVDLNLSSTNGEINKLFSVVGEDILFNASAVGNGSITAKFFDRQLTIDLVCKKPTEIITFNPITIFVEQIINFTDDAFTSILIPSEAGNLTYSTDDETILNVTNGGFNGLTGGTANIIVEFEETDEYAPSKVLVPVTVLKYDAEIMANDSITMDYNDFKSIEAKLLPNVGNFTYSSDNENIASVNDEGLISAVGVGTTNINVIFGGNRKYYATNKTIKLTVNKVDSSLQLNKDIKFNYSCSDYTLVTTEGDNGIEAFVINHPEANVDINNNKIIISGLDVGNYTLVVTTIPDHNHNSVNTTVPIIVSKMPTTIDVNNTALTLKVNQEVVAGAILIPANDVTLNFTSSNSSVAKVVDGKIVAVSKGSALISVSFAGDDRYLASESKTINVTVILNTSVSTHDLLLYVGENYYIYSYVVPNGLNITYISNDTSIARVDANGLVTGISKGIATITLLVGDDIKYAKNSTSARVTVKSFTSVTAPNVVKYYGGYERFVVTVEEDNKPVAGKLVTFYLNNQIYTRLTNNNGQASLAINLNKGVYQVTSEVEYKNIISTITVKSTLSSNDVTKIYKNGTHYYATFIDAKGNLMKNTDVNFNLNGGLYTRTTNSNGVACMEIDLNPGKYTITATNPQTGEQSTNLITVLPKFDLSAPDIIKYYGGSERFVATLKDFTGKAIDNADVKITINGKTYTKTTDSKGFTSIGLNLNSGNYNVTTEYDGIKIYSTVTIKDTVISTDFSKIYRNGTQYFATFKDSNGDFLRNTNVKFNINGVFYTRTTNINGIARLNINLNPGIYILTAENPSNGEKHANSITVLPNIVENYDLTKYYKNNSQYRVRLLDDAGKPVGTGVDVTFNINGVFYTRSTDANGYAKMNINLGEGTYIITADYKGLKASNTIKVLPILSANDLIMTYHDGSRFVAKLLNGQGSPYSGQTVIFNINGVFYDRITDNNGQVSLNINLDSGKYIITSSYNAFNIANEIIINPSYQQQNSNPQQTNTNNNQHSSSTQTYIGNTNSKIFHNPNCSTIKKMRNSNKITLHSRQEAINNGYRPCKVCKP